MIFQYVPLEASATLHALPSLVKGVSMLTKPLPYGFFFPSAIASTCTCGHIAAFTHASWHLSAWKLQCASWGFQFGNMRVGTDIVATHKLAFASCQPRSLWGKCSMRCLALSVAWNCNNTGQRTLTSNEQANSDSCSVSDRHSLQRDDKL